jgi:YidC/Oxa1 family membrane protein insertase
MDRRLILAIGLMLIVAVLPSILFPPQRPTTPAGESVIGDSMIADVADTLAEEPVAQQLVTPRPVPPESQIQLADTGSSAVSHDSVVVESELYRYVFSTQGARLISATLKSYRSFATGDSGPAQLIPDASEFFQLALVFGSDTVHCGAHGCQARVGRAARCSNGEIEPGFQLRAILVGIGRAILRGRVGCGTGPS